MKKTEFSEKLLQKMRRFVKTPNKDTMFDMLIYMHMNCDLCLCSSQCKIHSVIRHSIVGTVYELCPWSGGLAEIGEYELLKWLRNYDSDVFGSKLLKRSNPTFTVEIRPNKIPDTIVARLYLALTKFFIVFDEAKSKNQILFEEVQSLE